MTKSTLENEALKFCAFQFCFDREERVRRQIPFLCFWLKELPLQPAVTVQYSALRFFFFTLKKIFFFDSCALDCRNCTAVLLERKKSQINSCAFHVFSITAGYSGQQFLQSEAQESSESLFWLSYSLWWE